jgi:sulfonate transport system substrate-binding protein
VLVKNAAEISDPANRDAWSAEMAQQSQIPQALFLEELQPQDLNFTTSPRIDPFLTDSFSNSVEQAKSGRLIRSAFDVSQWVDGQFVEQALKAQGWKTAGRSTMPKARRKTPVNLSSCASS